VIAAQSGTILALDFGGARVGVAMASAEARLAHPVGTLKHDGQLLNRVKELCEKESVTHIVIGLPRGLDGQTTHQTELAQAFGDELVTTLHVPISWQDEAVTSVQAEAELMAKHKPYKKEDIDALAATYILEDYLHGTI
jgi:putative pre-16S rRNA nuclease